MLHSIHFTLPEARELLTQIKDEVQTIADLKRELDNSGYNIYRHHFFSGQQPNGEKYHPSELKLISKIKRINDMGVLIKGLDNGLIDFPSIRSNGEEVYLCWQLGEKDIGF